MTIAAAKIVANASTLLQDEVNVRWTRVELVRWLNAGLRELATIRPDAFHKTETINLVNGSRQDLAVLGTSLEPLKLIELYRNMANYSTKQVVRLVPRHILDAQVPDWHNLPGTISIVHYTFDPRDPTVFYVYPPAQVGAKLEGTYSAVLPDVVEPAGNAAIADVIALPAVFSNCLLDYVLYRAFSKDAETANATRADGYYASFKAGAGNEVAATVSVQPTGGT